jgi:hypothetical protein
MKNNAMNIEIARDILESQMNNLCYSENFRNAMKIAVEALNENIEAKQSECKYFVKGGLCSGQKCMPECTPHYGYCPLVRKDQ